MSVTATCAKVPYQSRLWAERAAEEHVTESAPCEACRRGGRMMPYRCRAADAKHWHIGHAWPRRPR